MGLAGAMPYTDAGWSELGASMRNLHAAQGAPGYNSKNLHLSLEALGLTVEGRSTHHSVGRFDGASDAVAPFMALMNSLGAEEGLALIRKLLEHLLALHVRCWCLSPCCAIAAVALLKRRCGG